MGQSQRQTTNSPLNSVVLAVSEVQLLPAVYYRPGKRQSHLSLCRRNRQVVPAVQQSQFLRQPLGQTLQCWRAVERVEPHIEQTETFFVTLGHEQGLVELL